ncbi:hypothetical protein L2E82_30324 [Cichorium intybus]|uniref:Uncharacterized protein n=1 Tax=Cichorium intybus TaxID=13427 RepID=A0ACB9CZZ6_CICIN|nr:hypothetical protein L2E82_30324 [Cichorium intybus]
MATHKGNFELQKFDDGSGSNRGIDVVVGGGGGVEVVINTKEVVVGVWCDFLDSCRLGLLMVSRASGGKDRHNKVLTSKGLRDRCVRSDCLSLPLSSFIIFKIYDQPNKAVEWLLMAASSSIDELPSLNPSFPGVISHNHHHLTRVNRRS